MLTFHDKDKVRKKLYSRPVFFILLLLTLVVVKGTWNVYWKRAESSENLVKVSQEAEVLRNREEDLENDIDKLETQAGIETEIRKKFSVVKEGEQMVVLVDDEKPAPPPPEPKPGFFKRVWNSITGIFKDDEDTASSTISSAELRATTTRKGDSSN